MPTEDKKALADRIIWTVLFVCFLGGIFFKREFWSRAEPLTLGDLYFYQGLAIAFLDRDWAHFFHFHFYPGYPVFMALMHELTGASFVNSARWLNILFDSLSLFPVYLIAREIFSRRVAVFSAVFWSFCWPYFRIYGDPEPVYGFFAFLSLYLVLRKQAGWKSYLGAIALASISALIKSEAAFFLALVTLIYLIKGQEKLSGKLAPVAGAILIYLALTSPIWVKYYQATGKFNPNPKSKTLFFIHNPVKEYQLFLYGMREDQDGLYTYAQRIYIEGDKDAVKTSLLDYTRENFKLLFFSYFSKLGFSFSSMLLTLLWRIYPGAFLLMLFYLLRRASVYDFRHEGLLWLWAATYAAAVSAYAPWERFFYPFFPVLIMLVAKGLDRMFILPEALYLKAFPDSRHPKLRPILKWGPAGLFIVWFLFFNLYGTTHFKPEKVTAGPLKLKSALAKDLKSSLALDSIVMCRGFPEPFTYFLDLPFWQMVITPLAEEEDVIKYAQETKARYLFVEARDLERNPELDRWLFGEVQNPAVKRLLYVPKAAYNDYYPYAWWEFLPAGTKSKD